MSDITSGTLYLVATPIGNLSDISARALKTLNEVDFIAAEDTRVTRKLLEHFDIKKQLVSYYHHNKRISGEKILTRLIDGENCALVTDAGTPCISDPGEDLVRMCSDEDISIIIIPGPCAGVAALTLSGLPTERFTFEGYLSTEKKKRLQHLEELKAEKRTMVFYEAPHKLKRTLKDMLNAFGNRRISISREMTKIYEETLRITLAEAVELFETKPQKGEFVIVVDGASEPTSQDVDLDEAVAFAISLIEKGLSTRDAVKKAAEETGCSRNMLYKSVTESLS